MTEIDEDDWGVEHCDADAPTIYPDPDTGRMLCRCLVCARCNHHTGNSNQGHFWSYCSVTQSIRDFHFCCPDNCQLEENDEDHGDDADAVHAGDDQRGGGSTVLDPEHGDLVEPA